MIFSYRKWLTRLRFIVLFMALTILLYQVMVVLTGWIQPTNKYKTPAGKSVKVFQQHQHALVQDTGASMSDRLRLFYWYGE
ncbi:DUF4227 family protein [Paenibacillus sedimenti]|uniref:YqzK family protein n=1 Tax=Paenibacillus sedimenti TaxID=2770274 RepID=A0A926KR32_9BACL|nr:DUF4227 family protein [Paenibacillus sedimenti]MBD0380669.1 YqzK family protein [Paenibacillus sedimenti]